MGKEGEWKNDFCVKFFSLIIFDKNMFLRFPIHSLYNILTWVPFLPYSIAQILFPKIIPLPPNPPSPPKKKKFTKIKFKCVKT